MAAGLTNHLWTVEEIISLVDNAWQLQYEIRGRTANGTPITCLSDKFKWIVVAQE